MMISERKLMSICSYMIDNESTLREAEQVFDISRSTLHRYINHDLPQISTTLYNQMRNLMDYNKSVALIHAQYKRRQKLKSI
jgi:putative DeoR family transcriptional regulator (stage III sporulation protein D)